jgi:hypothetical protein
MLFGYSKPQMLSAIVGALLTGVAATLGAITVTNRVVTGQWLPTPLLVAAQRKVLQKKGTQEVANVVALYNAMDSKEQDHFNDWLADRALSAIIGTRPAVQKTATA